MISAPNDGPVCGKRKASENVAFGVSRDGDVSALAHVMMTWVMDEGNGPSRRKLEKYGPVFAAWCSFLVVVRLFCVAY